MTDIENLLANDEAFLVKQVDEDYGLIRTTATIAPDGTISTEKGLRIARALPVIGNSVNAIVGGMTTTISLVNHLPAESIRVGWTIQTLDATTGNDYAVVKSLSLDTQGKIQSFIAQSPFTFDHKAGVGLTWEPVLDPTANHYIRAAYQTGLKGDPKTGSGLELGGHVFVAADGSLYINGHLALDSLGQAVGVAPGALKGQEFQYSNERSGFVAYDGAKSSSGTQTGDVYNPTHTAITNGQVLGGATGLTWQNAVLSGINTNVLLMTTGATVSRRWTDTLYAPVVVLHDQTIDFPVYFSVNGVVQATAADGYLALAVSSGSGVSVRLDKPSTANLTQLNDIWVINPGGTNMEQVTISGGQPGGDLVFSSVAHNHSAGERIVLYKASGGVTRVEVAPKGSDSQWHVTGYMSPTMDAVSIGFQDTNSNWYRAFWGDPTWIPPWGTSAVYMGAIPPVQGHLVSVGVWATDAWGKLTCRLSDIGLWTLGSAPITINTVEVGAYSTSSASMQWDAATAGFTTHPVRMVAETVAPKNLTPNFALPQLATSQTGVGTVGAAGGGPALPATPVGYLTIQISGSTYKLPYYNP